MHRKEIEIRWRDMDALGHVTNSVFQTYFEEVRDELFERTLHDPDVARNFVLVHIAISFRKTLTQADDVVTATCEFLQFGNSSVTTRETIVDREGNVCAEAESVTVAWEPLSNRSRPLTPTQRAAFEDGARLPRP